MSAQGPSAVLLGEPAHVTMEEAAAAAESPESENISKAAIEPDERSEESDSSELEDWEWLRQNDIFSEDLWMAPRDSAQPLTNGGRAVRRLKGSAKNGKLRRRDTRTNTLAASVRSMCA